MVQTTGVDTVIDQYQPTRSNPIARRVIRRYHCDQTISGSSIFEQLTFSVEQTDEQMVINEMRLCLPLEVRGYRYEVDQEGRFVKVPVQMNTNTWDASNNIALSQDSPWSAFSDMHISINGKSYSKQYPRFSKMMSQCFQTYSELGFQDDESLKPIANTYLGQSDLEEYPVYDEDGEGIASVSFEKRSFEPITFSQQELNSGFSSRRRHFVQGLEDSGKCWKGTVSSLFNSAIFNSEARRDGGNDMIPYVKSLYVKAMFDTAPDNMEKQNKLSQLLDLPRYCRTLPQKLLSFLTPMTASFQFDDRAHHRRTYPTWFEMKWTGLPYIEIEWCKLAKPLLRPVYKLRAAQYQLDQTLPFHLQSAAGLNPQDIRYVSTRIQRDLLSVPNLIYIWATPTRASFADNFCWGSMFRCLDIKNLKIRVNGQTDIIQNPPDHILYKWYKRNTNNVFEYDVWCKNKVIVISPSEIGLQEWLENDSRLSTLNIECDVGFSRLMLPELKVFRDRQYLSVGGLQLDDITSEEDPAQLPNFEGIQGLNGRDGRPRFYISPPITTGTSVRKVPNKNKITLQLRHTASDRTNTDSIDRIDQCRFPMTTQDYSSLFQNVNIVYRDQEPERNVFKVDRINGAFFQWTGDVVFWLQVQIAADGEHVIMTADQLQSGNKDPTKIVYYVTNHTHIFQKKSPGKQLEMLEWNLLLDAEHLLNHNLDGTVDAQILQPGEDKSRDATQGAHTQRDAFWNRVQDVIASNQLCTWKNKPSDWYSNSRVDKSPHFILNEVDGGGNPSMRKGSWQISDELMYVTEESKDWVYGDYKHKTSDDTATNEIDSIAAKDGYAWVPMAHPGRFISHQMFRHTLVSGDTNYQYSYASPSIYLDADVTGGQDGAQNDQYEIPKTDESGQQIDYDRGELAEFYVGSREALVGAVNEPEFQLNLLTEYGKQSCLMSSDRGKPAHFPNLVPSV